MFIVRVIELFAGLDVEADYCIHCSLIKARAALSWSPFGTIELAMIAGSGSLAISSSETTLVRAYRQGAGRSAIALHPQQMAFIQIEELFP